MDPTSAPNLTDDDPNWKPPTRANLKVPLKRAPRPISLSELGQHNKTTDAWIAVRGKVYDVTEFLDRHPGGDAMLMAGVGKDATSLFENYHHYINPDGWVGSSYLGPLQ